MAYDRSLSLVALGLKIIGCGFGLGGFYQGVIIYPPTITFLWILSALSISFVMDGFILDEIRDMVAIGRKWAKHFALAVLVMHIGAILAVVTLVYNPSLFVDGSMIIFFVGMAACINQVAQANEYRDE